MALSRKDRRLRIKRRIRKVVKGTNEQPRLSVFRSNKEIYAQIINDITGTTLVAASSRDKDVKAKGNKTEVASIVGKAIAEKAVKAGIENIAFDRNGYLYHGRVKALADAAREGGLKF
ncbi:MAG: 50S ribosomal protein L18 [Flavobacteriales bacterium]|jgi:large subunit ribosomal protein L18|nr:50S ribosomal protein L18 [Flavobacteriales bacterium]MCW8912632.1 50S ribosomal protein L18 [Flavobacteriales bacterium]MCW8938237.1 50S ribosomal protein L18 [Flavobacteriales bacterium]MCW8941296.1 50S ribosomal protein L18 [Flavobacteriales bacterium]MCW8966971.1 50S ribosomal protein L18 [Flavobacteriales bacterium]